MTVFSVLGIKGGVSKSTLAMGLSIWISKLKPNWHVLLIDGDLHVRSAELKMCPARDVTLADVLAGKRSWEDAVYTCQLVIENKLLYPNLAIIPAGGRFLPQMKGGSALAYLDQTRRIFNKMMRILREKFDTIIIDTPASVSYEHLILTAIADQIIYVCEANDDSIDSTLTTARGLVSFMEVEAAGVVLSKVMDDVDTAPWVKKANKIAQVLGIVPFDPAVDDAFRDNLPVVAAYPNSPASLSIKEIAKKLLKAEPQRPAELLKRLDIAVRKVAAKVEAGR